MFGSTTLDLVIGLVFVFLLYSLLATIVQELIASWLGFRSRMLEKAIIRMLNDGRTNPEADASMKIKMGHGMKAILERVRGFFFKRPRTYAGSFAAAFYNHPSVKYLAEDAWHSKPSYMNAKQFSTALLDILRGEDMKPGEDVAARIHSKLFPPAKEGEAPIAGLAFTLQPETSAYLKSMYLDAGNDLEKFRKSLEEWFDNTMERASGWYKKHVQLVLFFIGIGIAVFFNVNTFKIVSVLSKDKNARDQLVQLASTSDKYSVTVNEIDSTRKKENKYVFVGSDSVDKKRDSVYTLVKTDLDKSSEILALGWKVPVTKDTSFCNSAFKGDGGNIKKCRDCLASIKCVNKNNELGFFSQAGFVIRTQVNFKVVAGWLVTALAISLGAPFWFDLLNKFMKLRGSAAQKKDSKKEKK